MVVDGSLLSQGRRIGMLSSTNNRHTPPPGLAFGEPDDRLQRGIQYAAASRFHRWRLWNTGITRFPRVMTVEAKISIGRDAFIRIKARVSAALPVMRWPAGCTGVPDIHAL